MESNNVTMILSKYRYRYVILAAFVIITLCEWKIWDGSIFKRVQALRLHMLLFPQMGLGLGTYLLWHRLFTFTGLRDMRPLKMIFIMIFLLSLCSFWIGLFFPLSNESTFPTLCFICLGIHAQLLTGRLMFGLLCTSYFVVAKIVEKYGSKLEKPKVPRNVTRIKRTQQRQLALFTIIYTVVISTVGILSAKGLPKIKQVDVIVPDLPFEFNGYTIAVVSDVHIGPTVGKSRFVDLIGMLDIIDKDAVAIVGDLVDAPIDTVSDVIGVLRHLKAPDGVFFVTGNHDYYNGDVEELLHRLRALNVTVLHNENRVLEKGGSKLCIAGVDDHSDFNIGVSGHGLDLAAAVRGCSPEVPSVLLSHRPSGAKLAMDSIYNIPIAISGHTHGGQFFPFSLLVYLGNPYFSGLYHVTDRKSVYVTQGTFFYGMPMRIGSSMEVTRLVLQKYGAL